MTDSRFKWLALGLAALGIAGLLLVASASLDSALLGFAVAAAVLVLLLPVAAYLVFRRRRAEEQ
jgi:amino acid transporter